MGYFQNQAVRIGDVAFFLTTLWSVITNPNKNIIRRSLNDLHMKCLDFLDKGLGSEEKHKVVVSHHVPARSCFAPRYLDSPLTDAFCANLDKFIELRDIDAWIYGHSHTNIDRAIGNTKSGFLSGKNPRDMIMLRTAPVYNWKYFCAMIDDKTASTSVNNFQKPERCFISRCRK